MSLKRKDYPKEFHIGSEVYRLKFVRKLPKNTVGECDPSDKEIRVLCGLGPDETLKCVIHELCHAIFEFEHDVCIKHKMIYDFEEPLFRFIRDNFL